MYFGKNIRVRELEVYRTMLVINNLVENNKN